MKALTRQQQRFCEEYIADSNATQAYLRAGYKASESSAAQAASRLLTNVKVLAEVARLEAARSKRTEITADQVLVKWAELAFAPVDDPDVPAAVQKSAVDSIAKHLGMFDKKPAQAENVMLVLNMGRPPED